MGNIQLIRIDSRLIHGQVITKWLKIAKASTIIIVEDELAEDEFMGNIYATAAPKGVRVLIYSTAKAIEEWNRNCFGNEDILLLFKDVETCYQLHEMGLPMRYVQIGGVPSAPGRTTILRAVSLNQKDMECITNLHNKGIQVEIHIIPEEPKMDYDKIVKKFKN